MEQDSHEKSGVAIIGGGPAGLMAAETLASAGVSVTVFDRMPSVGRKLLLAGRGGLNLTHSEPSECFAARYGPTAAWMEPLLEALPPSAVIDWCEALGQPTFVGSSGRVFPVAMKASPLLRAWLMRLESLDVRFKTRATWAGFEARALLFANGSTYSPDAVVLALGGASWPKLGSDGAWTRLLPDVAIEPLRPANCGFTSAWSEMFGDRHAGTPLKRVSLTFESTTIEGEILLTEKGIEDGAVYALAAALREAIACDGSAEVTIDLRPDVSFETLANRLAGPRGGASLSNFLRKRAGLPAAAVGLIQEALHNGETKPLENLIKAFPLRLLEPFALTRAISTAGGIALAELDEHLMLRAHPGVFGAGEMLDWEAPTGGYLLQGCLATGAAAGRGVLNWLHR